MSDERILTPEEVQQFWHSSNPNHPNHVKHLRSSHEALRAERDALASRVEALEKAAKPFADAVFNDNGDVTLNLSGIHTGQYLAIKAAIAELERS